MFVFWSKVHPYVASVLREEALAATSQLCKASHKSYQSPYPQFDARPRTAFQNLSAQEMRECEARYIGFDLIVLEVRPFRIKQALQIRLGLAVRSLCKVLSRS